MGAHHPSAPALRLAHAWAAGGDGAVHVLLQFLLLLSGGRLPHLGPAGGGVFHDRGAEHRERPPVSWPSRIAAHAGRRRSRAGWHRRFVLAGGGALRPRRRVHPRTPAPARWHLLLSARHHLLRPAPPTRSA